MQRQRLPDVASAGAGVIRPYSPNVIAAAAYCVEVVRACAYVRAVHDDPRRCAGRSGRGRRRDNPTNGWGGRGGNIRHSDIRVIPSCSQVPPILGQSHQSFASGRAACKRQPDKGHQTEWSGQA